MDNNVFIAKGAAVIGKVYLEDDVNIWYHATVRGDREPIEIGYGTNVQDNVVIHMDEGFPVKIGKYVSIGHGAILHGCTIEDGSLIGMGAILLDGAHIGKNCIIGAGTLITQNAQIPDGSLVIGSPGKWKRNVTEEEIKLNMENAKRYIKEGRERNNQ